MSKLRSARTQRGWSQAQAIHALTMAAKADGRVLPGVDSMRIMLSRWENGHVRPDTEYRRWLRMAYEATDHDLGFGEEIDAHPAVGLPVLTRELLTLFEHSFRSIAAMDNEFGSATVLAAAEAEATVLCAVAAGARGPLRREVMALAGRYSELCGWLRQDAGDLDGAYRWSDSALGWATELGDPEQTSYVLMRKSNVATDAGQADRALGLAQSSLSAPSVLSSQFRAAALRQVAAGHALSGAQSACLGALEQAREALEEAAGVDARAPYVQQGYLGSEAGKCLVSIGMPEAAELVTREALTAWPAQMRRDRALCLSRRALALAEMNAPEASAEALTQAIDLARSISSERLRKEIRTAGRRLSSWRKLDSVQEVTQSIAELHRGVA